MIQNRKFHKERKKAYDEYYTNEFEVKYILEELIKKEQLKDKIIYSCADGEESEFVKYFKSHKDELGYKEYIYTSDDFRTHEDLFEKADFVITNPPFSLNMELLPIIKRYENKFFLFGSLGMIYGYYKIFNMDKCKYLYRRYAIKNAIDYFNTPHINESTGEKWTLVNYTIYLSNMDLNEECLEFKRREYKKKYADMKKHDFFYYEDRDPVLVVDYMRDVPIDYDKEILCPVSVMAWANGYCFDILGMIESKPIRWDGKSRFVRVLCKFRPEKNIFRENNG